MKVIVNGKELDLKQKMTVSRFLEENTFGKLCVVELNGKILTKDKHETTFLKDADRIDIFEITGGG